MRLQKHINEARLKASLYEIVQILYDNCKPWLKEMAKTGYACDLLSGRGEDHDYFTRDVRMDRIPKDTPREISDDFDDEFMKQHRWMPRQQSLFTTGSRSDAGDYGNIYCIFPVGKYKYLWSPEVGDLWQTIEGERIDELYNSDFEPNDYEIDERRNEFYYEAMEEFENDNPRPEEDDYVDDDEPDEYAYDNASEDWGEEQRAYAAARSEEMIEEWITDQRMILRDEVSDRISAIVYSYKNKDMKRAIMSNREIMLTCKQYVAVDWNRYHASLSSFIKWFNWKKKPTIKDIEAWSLKMRLSNDKELLWKESEA